MNALPQLVVEGFPIWLTPKEAIGLLGCGRQTLLAYHQAGKIRCRTTPKGHRRYCRDDILQLVKP